MAIEKVVSNPSYRVQWYRDGVGVGNWSMRLSNIPGNLKKSGIAASSLLTSSFLGFFSPSTAEPSMETIAFNGRNNQTHYKCDFTNYAVTDRTGSGVAVVSPLFSTFYTQLLHDRLCNATMTTLSSTLSYELITDWLDNNKATVAQFWRGVGEIKDVDFEKCINDMIQEYMNDLNNSQASGRAMAGSVIGTLCGTGLLMLLLWMGYHKLKGMDNLREKYEELKAYFLPQTAESSVMTL